MLVSVLEGSPGADAAGGAMVGFDALPRPVVAIVEVPAPTLQGGLGVSAVVSFVVRSLQETDFEFWRRTQYKPGS